MSTHVATAATPAVVFPAAPGWLTLSAAFGVAVPMIADRDDIVVTVAPGAGHGAPACFFPDLATIEVDGVHVDSGVDPATVAPHRVGDRKRHRTAWSLLTHECAHAKHSVWRAPDDAPPGAAAAAELLEESRIEAAQLRRRTRARLLGADRAGATFRSRSVSRCPRPLQWSLGENARQRCCAYHQEARCR